MGDAVPLAGPSSPFVGGRAPFLLIMGDGTLGRVSGTAGKDGVTAACRSRKAPSVAITVDGAAGGTSVGEGVSRSTISLGAGVLSAVRRGVSAVALLSAAVLTPSARGVLRADVGCVVPSADVMVPSAVDQDPSGSTLTYSSSCGTRLRMSSTYPSMTMSSGLISRLQTGHVQLGLCSLTEKKLSASKHWTC